MNMYDFSTVINRAGTGSVKVDMAPEPVRGSGLVPLTIADQEFAVAPEIREAIIEAANRQIYGYTYPDESYRDAVDSWMARRHNWNTKGMPMFTTPGVVAALGLAVRTFSEKGEGVIIQPPVYFPFSNAIKSNDRVIVENPLILEDGKYRIDFEDFEKKASRDDVHLFIMCSPHNPVGRVWKKDELCRIVDICNRNNVFIISDEIHNDLIMPGNEHTVLATIPGAENNCMICTAVSKTFSLAGLCCSNIFIPNKDMAEKFAVTSGREGTRSIPYFSRYATIAAYNKAEPWVDALIEAVNENFLYLYDFIDTKLPMLHAIRAEGTYLAWIDMRALGLSDEELEKLMLKNYLALDEGYIFGTNGSGFERWNLALPKKLLADALDRLYTAVNSL